MCEACLESEPAPLRPLRPRRRLCPCFDWWRRPWAERLFGRPEPEALPAPPPCCPATPHVNWRRALIRESLDPDAHSDASSLHELEPTTTTTTTSLPVAYRPPRLDLTWQALVEAAGDGGALVKEPGCSPARSCEDRSTSACGGSATGTTASPASSEDGLDA